MKRHLTISCLLSGTALILIAASLYPGGSPYDLHANGFSFEHNYLCNLFDPNAMDGRINAGRWWAIAGMFILCFGLGHFYFRFSKRLAGRYFNRLIAIAGISSSFFAFLVVTDYHDTMITIACVLSLVTICMILVSLWKLQMHLYFRAGILCLLFLIIIYALYSTRQFLFLLPLSQKVSFVFVAAWFIALEYADKKR